MMNRDKAHGILLGQAIGDALGAFVEFKPRGSFETPRDFRNGGPHRLKAGMWTDDTIMAVHLAEHLTRATDYDANDLMGRWWSWYERGVHSPTGACFDIGTRTAAALVHWNSTGKILKETRPFAEGNGAIMRVSPVAIRYRHMTVRRHAAEWQSLLTHGRLAAKTAVALTDALAVLLAGGNRVDALEAANHHMGGTWADPRGLRRENVHSGGHCLDTIEAAFWCLLEAENAEECIMEAVSLGDDADTTAAVAGALAGAYWGANGLPERWRSKLYWRRGLVNLADALLEHKHD